MGSAFRTSDGALIRKLYLCGYTPHPPRKEIEKTALGSTKSVAWEYHADPLVAIAAVKAEGARVCVLEQTTQSTPYYNVSKKDFPICLIVGNEITGVSPQVIAAADMAIDIPMYGVKQSLNAAVAYGIALFELVKIWTPGKLLQHIKREREVITLLHCMDANNTRPDKRREYAGGTLF